MNELPILYTIGCPACAVLEKKLIAKGIDYRICNDTEIMQQKGYEILPVLEVNGKSMNFKIANAWVNEL